MIPRTKLRVHSECGIHQFPFIMARIPIAGRLWASSGLVIRVAMAGWPNNAKPPVPFFTPAVTVPGVPFFWVTSVITITSRGHQCHQCHQSPVRASCKKHEVGQCLGSRHFGNWAKKGRRFWSVRAEDGWKTVQLLPKRCYSKTIQSLFKSIIL